MKYLTVLRHAKSSWDHPGLPDHDRPLNERGLRAGPAMAQFFHHTYGGGMGGEPLLPYPSIILSSTAKRAHSTAAYLHSQLSVPLQTVPSLYLASPQTLIGQVRDIDDSHQHALLVAHNPGLHDFCCQLLARATVPRMPTATMVIMGLPYEHWSLADWAEAQLIGYVTPRSLERSFPEKYPRITRQAGEQD
jgi:phosphohistidine phosphatase